MLNNMLLFVTDFLGIVADFLASEPIIYFVALFMLLFVVRLFIGLARIRN